MWTSPSGKRTEFGRECARREEGEACMSVLRLPLAEVRRMVRDGEIQSGTVVAALHHLLELKEERRRMTSFLAGLALGTAVAVAGLALSRRSRGVG
mmetsp:Transcript_20039/g.55849  ORF Transcript_20039/g.55849 Transcript_20039/m.55849 type:complete len:96 (+) Transcript_20039:237-524(+)